MKALKYLTIAQVRSLRTFTDERSADTLAIVMSCGCTKEEAEAFYDTAPAGELLQLLSDIFEISGLGEGAQFRGGSGDVPGDARPEV